MMILKLKETTLNGQWGAIVKGIKDKREP